ncbi:hypothetical protein ACQV5I_10045 [Leptospira interrogans]|uniref:hypothetical protein n=1 Tax=Leptospira interrogans TaxID=173 RepID=UPI0002BB2BA9|nr:hypothetical protein [Leptospira interrogans]
MWQKTIGLRLWIIADTPGAEVLLEDLFRQTQKVLIDEDFGELVLQFPYGTKLLAREEYPTQLCDEIWPQSFKNAVVKHCDLSFVATDGSMGLLLGVNPGFHGEYLNDPDRNMDENPLKSWLVDKKTDIFSPAMTATHWWLYHPTEKNSCGEPAIYSFSHSDGLKSLGDFNVGGLFLRYVLDILLQ